MSLEDAQLPYAYVAYIDDAGDDGLRKVRPIEPDGASELLVQSAVVVAAQREAEVLPWLREIRPISGTNEIGVGRLLARAELWLVSTERPGLALAKPNGRVGPDT
jgi:hypothetical protein